MGYCGTCGHALDDDSGFCSYCGAEHSADGATALPGRPRANTDAPDTLTFASQSQAPASAPSQSVRSLPPIQTETVVAGRTSTAPSADGRRSKSGGRWMLAVSIAVIVAACAAIVTMVLLRDNGSDTVIAPVSPSPSATIRAVVKIMSPSSGNKVIGGQAMSVVAVMATGVTALQGMQLTVNGEPVGPSRLGTGTGGSKTVSLPWRPPAKGGTVVLGVQAVLQDGSVIPSKPVRVVVRPATVPTPTVTVTAQPEPTYGTDGGSDGGSSTRFWAAMICSKVDLAEAEDWAARAREAGFTNVRILNSSDYGSLHPGYWCAYLGPYSSESAAEVGVAELNAAGLGRDHPYASHVY